MKIYLNTLLSQDPETWGGLAGLPQIALASGLRQAFGAA